MCRIGAVSRQKIIQFHSYEIFSPEKGYKAMVIRIRNMFEHAKYTNKTYF